MYPYSVLKNIIPLSYILPSQATFCYRWESHSDYCSLKQPCHNRKGWLFYRQQRTTLWDKHWEKLIILFWSDCNSGELHGQPGWCVCRSEGVCEKLIGGDAGRRGGQEAVSARQRKVRKNSTKKRHSMEPRRGHGGKKNRCTFARRWF